MDLGTLLVVIGLVIALVSIFTIPATARMGEHRLLAVAVLLVGIGVLLGSEGFRIR